MTDLNAMERAGRVRRWHQNADLCDTFDPVAYHSGRVARICMAIWPDCSGDLLKAALSHDDGESGGWGDIPGPAKAAMPPAARQAMIEAEYQARYAIWGRDVLLSGADRQWLELADKLDAMMWAARHAPHVLDRDGWPEARAWLEAAGIELGVSQFVRKVIG
jgi:5'-deoxynucleotidase YfbR-like HD superfamily hydrolase